VGRNDGGETTTVKHLLAVCFAAWRGACYTLWPEMVTSRIPDCLFRRRSSHLSVISDGCGPSSHTSRLKLTTCILVPRCAHDVTCFRLKTGIASLIQSFIIYAGIACILCGSYHQSQSFCTDISNIAYRKLCLQIMRNSTVPR